jgi:thiol:disulfide interchange protein DsbD
MGKVTQRTQWLSALLVLLIVSGCYAGSEETAPGKINWIHDLNEGLRLARENGKPAMLYFTADWCAPCVELKKYVFSDKRVAVASRRLVNVYIEVDQNYDALATYKVRGIPTIFFVSPAGEIISRYAGDRSAPALVKQMNAVADQHSK